MDSWTKGPFSANPTYAGVRVRGAKLEQVSRSGVAKALALSDLRSVTLTFGNFAERLGLRLGLALVVTSGGVVWLSRSWAALFATAGSLNAVAAAVAVTGGGLWFFVSSLFRRFYLLAELDSGPRKVVFAPGAEPRGLSLFIANAKKRGLEVAVPGDFAQRSRFVGREAPRGLRKLERRVDTAELDSFALFVRDDALFDLLTKSFADWLERYLKEGAQIRDRQVLVCGQHLLLCEVEGRRLTLLAPGNDPDDWSLDLRAPLLTRARQQLVVKSFGLPAEPPNPQLLISVEKMAGRGPVRLLRAERDAEKVRIGHSGWSVFSAGSGDERKGKKPEIIALTIADFGTLRPDLLELLALPAGHSVDFVGGKTQVLRGEQPLKPDPDSYMHCKLHGYALPPHLTGAS